MGDMMRKAPYVSLFLAALAVSACASESGSPAESTQDPTEATATGVPVTFTLTVPGGPFALDFCPRPAGYDEAEQLVGDAKRLKVRITDINDEVVANTFSETTIEVDPADAPQVVLDMYGDELGDGLAGKGCTITAEFADVPDDLDFYTFQADVNETNFTGGASDLAPLTLSLEEMQEADWVVATGFGN